MGKLIGRITDLEDNEYAEIEAILDRVWKRLWRKIALAVFLCVVDCFIIGYLLHQLSGLNLWLK